MRGYLLAAGILIGMPWRYGARLARAPHSDKSSVVVRGLVVDSIAMTPLAGASVQMVLADSGGAVGRYGATSDSAGRFEMSDVRPGRYVIGFYHIALDTLGIEVLSRALTVTDTSIRITLGTPSAATLIEGFCSGEDSKGSRGAGPTGSHTLLLGHVENVHTQSPVESASVKFAWAAVEQGSGGMAIVDRQAQAQTHGGGLFAICGLPEDAAISASTSHAGDSSGVITLHMPSSRFLHVSIAIGAPDRHGRVVGHATDTINKPVSHAHVTIGGRVAITSEDGSFVVDSVKVGSQAAEVRAVGYAPRTDIVRVADDRPTPFSVTLERVTALPLVVSSASPAGANLAQYLRDKRTNATGAVFVEPIRANGYKSEQSACQLVNAATNLDYCRTNHPYACPALLVNGVSTKLRIEDIDPDDIIGVEGWRAGGTPSRYIGIRACPFVIWTRCLGATIPTCGDDLPLKPTPDRPSGNGG